MAMNSRRLHFHKLFLTECHCSTCIAAHRTDVHTTGKTDSILVTVYYLCRSWTSEFQSTELY